MGSLINLLIGLVMSIFGSEAEVSQKQATNDPPDHSIEIPIHLKQQHFIEC